MFAALALAALMTSAVSLSAIHHEQAHSKPECQPTSSKRNNGFKDRTIKDGKLRWRVQLGPCISDELALQILRAIRDQKLVDRRPVPAGNVPQAMPAISDREVNSISVGDPLAAQLGWPVHEYQVETVDRHGNGLGGLVLFLNVRDSHVEFLGYAGWEA